MKTYNRGHGLLPGSHALQIEMETYDRNHWPPPGRYELHIGKAKSVVDVGNNCVRTWSGNLPNAYDKSVLDAYDEYHFVGPVEE
jgi:hypothetical protein